VHLRARHSFIAEDADVGGTIEQALLHGLFPAPTDLSRPAAGWGSGKQAVEQRLLDRPADVSVFSDKEMTLPAGAQTRPEKNGGGVSCAWSLLASDWHPLTPNRARDQVSGNRLAIPISAIADMGISKRRFRVNAKSGITRKMVFKTARSAGSAFADQLQG